MNRRDYLKHSAALLAASALPGCGERGFRARGDVAGGASSPDLRELFDRGEVPIERSGWTKTRGMAPAHAALQGDVQADVLVVGAGLAGASLALHLAQAGIRVVVLEARQPGWGASGRNAGHVLPVLKDLEVVRGFPDGGRQFLELFREHRSITFDLARRHGIECDGVQSGYLNVMRSKGAFEDFDAEAKRLENEQGLEVERLGAADVARLTGSSYYPYGVLYKAGGRINPYLFANGMVSAAIRHGATVHGHSEARTLAASGKRWRVSTASGSVTADRVVFCTNAYPTRIVPEFADSFYPLTAYALSTRPLPPEARAIVMPAGATLAQAPIDLNPFVVDGEGRIITSSIPSVWRPEDAAWHFGNHLAWIHRTWPQTRDLDIELETYWTGRVALRDREFPGAFAVRPGVFGLMHFNAWGNLMAPLMGMLLANALAADRMDRLAFPLEKPERVARPGKQDLIIRELLIPAARMGQKVGLI
ncbi:MAG: NAD(P)/FAD-dependent oxidoreductase [Steroidobacteraceae bacterium]